MKWNLVWLKQPSLVVRSLLILLTLNHLGDCYIKQKFGSETMTDASSCTIEVNAVSLSGSGTPRGGGPVGQL